MIAEFEELLIQEYASGVVLPDMLRTLMGLNRQDRDVVLHIVKAQEHQEKTNGKLC